mgnify:FL=1
MVLDCDTRFWLTMRICAHLQAAAVGVGGSVFGLVGGTLLRPCHAPHLLAADIRLLLLCSLSTAELLANPEVGVGIAGVSLVAGVATAIGMAPSKRENIRKLLSEDGLTQLFRQRYHRELASRNEFVHSLWARALPAIVTVCETYLRQRLRVCLRVTRVR